MFVCGLKDVTISDASKIETIIFDVLKDLSEKGIDKEIIESAIHQIEFYHKDYDSLKWTYEFWLDGMVGYIEKFKKEHKKSS